MCNKYNGWSNYPTWCVKLWIDNDEGLYNEVKQLAQDCYDNAEAERNFTREERATLDFESILRDYIEELEPVNNSSSMSDDLLDWVFGEVDWYEIAAAIIEDNVDKTDDDEIDTDAED